VRPDVGEAGYVVDVKGSDTGGGGVVWYTGGGAVNIWGILLIT
jgi:hypothetical protein